VRQWWEDGDFAADRAACLEKLKQIARDDPEMLSAPAPKG